MMLGGLSDGCGELRAGLRTAFRNSTPSLRLPSAASSGSQRELPSGAAGADQETPRISRNRFLMGPVETVRAFAGLAPRLDTRRGWCDGSDFPKQGRKSAGVGLRQAGQGGQLPGWVLAYVSPLGRALGQAAVQGSAHPYRGGGSWSFLVPSEGRDWRPWGCYVLDVPGGTTVWPLDPAWTSPEYAGFKAADHGAARDTAG